MADNLSALRDESDPPPGREDELSILDLLIVVAKHKWLVLGLPLLAAVLAAVISTQLTHRYTATARLLPPQQSQSAAAALMGQLGQMGALAGGAAGALGLRTP
jgi:tyrosine-protein kinase Etk/Wzc